MTADLLRRASADLRAKADAATPGPWHHVGEKHALDRYRVVMGEAPVAATVGMVDATYIATMHPGVALALADWLEQEAEDIDRGGFTEPRALAVARAVLGSDQ